MALKTNKSTTLTGYSTVNGIQVLYLSANITKDNVGNTYINQSILNQAEYNSNRVECRKDIADFQSEVYAIEDEFIAEQESNTEETEGKE